MFIIIIIFFLILYIFLWIVFDFNIILFLPPFNKTSEYKSGEYLCITFADFIEIYKLDEKNFIFEKDNVVYSGYIIYFKTNNDRYNYQRWRKRNNRIKNQYKWDKIVKNCEKNYWNKLYIKSKDADKYTIK